MELKSTEISKIIKEQLADAMAGIETANVGRVLRVADGISVIHGLDNAAYGEMLEFPGGVPGMVLNLEEDSVGAVIFGDYLHIREGDEVRATGKILEVPVGDAMVGRVVNAVGAPIDGLGPIATDKTDKVEKIAPGIIAREPVGVPMQTGIKAIDALVPIGRGQRELIIGDRQTGKTTVAIDAIINQKGTGVICVYVAVGQKNSSVANVVRVLKEHGAMDHTIVVNASAAESAAMQYLAPYVGCTIAEHFRDTGRDALIIYDDLTKQAWAYRQISLLLRRPPGREAYPGDVFYLHSRLLERACRLNENFGGGSLTALPIIETQAGDVSAFVPTNVISITDGQIYLETDLFNSGIRPAINAGLSVSRVGGAAQTKIVRKLSGGLRTDLAQYRELAAFAQFASDLDASTRAQLERGKRATELLKQGENAPLSIAEQAAVLFALGKGLVDDVPADKMTDFERALQTYLRSEKADLVAKVNAEKALSDEIESELRAAIEAFKSSHTY